MRWSPDGMQRGRVFLGGDRRTCSRRQVGLATTRRSKTRSILAWKLASVVKGISPAALLDSYEIERRPVALRNTDYARASPTRSASSRRRLRSRTPLKPPARRDGWRAIHLEQHARDEFNIPGITFGGRYDGSPVIVSDGSAPPPDAANLYEPSACPGGRAPHAWLQDGVSLYDLFGFEWTLLQFVDGLSLDSSLSEIARALGVDLKLVTLPAILARSL